jgi:2-oxoglutarate ferredoxin oxidoreductase subunit beta
LEWGERIPLGILYQVERPTYEEQVVGLKQGPIATRKLDRLSKDEVERLRAEYM